MEELLKVGNIFSEVSHYKLLEYNGPICKLYHYETGDDVTLSGNYIKDCLLSGDLVKETLIVTKEDSRDGKPGIRTIFESIEPFEVFTVVFTEMGKLKTQSQIQKELKEQENLILKAVTSARKSKKSIRDTIIEVTKVIQENSVINYIEGEDRVLRGYKIKSDTRDGRYLCIDMDIEIKDKYGESNIRPVNINTIKSLIYKGVNYVVE